MNQLAVEFDGGRRATLKSPIFGYIHELRGRHRHDAANGVHQNADRAEDSTQDNHRRMQTRLLLGKIEEPVQAHNRNGGSSQIQETRQSRRQTRRRGEPGHGHDFAHCLERESAVQSARVKNQKILRALERVAHVYTDRHIFKNIFPTESLRLSATGLSGGRAILLGLFSSRKTADKAACFRLLWPNLKLVETQMPAYQA